MKLLVGFLSLATLFTTALGEDFPRLYEEQLISDLHLNAKEFLHYYLMVTSNIYKGDDHLTISAFETSYGSDPDIYISKVSFTRFLKIITSYLVDHANRLFTRNS